jgi:hypothetical protein
MTHDVITIPLTKGYEAIVDSIDADLADFKWRALVTTKHTTLVYATRWAYQSKRDKVYISQLLHRVILERVIGRPLVKRELCDLIDGNGLNCRRSNLRLVDRTADNQNQRKSRANTSGYKGVSYRKDKDQWVAYIGIGGRSIHLGYFETPEEAHEAYCRAAKENFGRFANSGNDGIIPPK